MNTYNIYTDGSHFKGKGSGRLGIGGVLVDPLGSGYGKLINKFSEEITPEYLKFEYNTSDCSNPTMELYAVYYALSNFKGSYTDKDLIIVRADYLGVSKWLNSEWKINKPYIKKIRDQIFELIKKYDLNVKFEWIPGHQKVTNSDSYWNNFVDSLSKGE